MNYVFTVLAIILLALGIVGSVVPGLPGPPLAWAGLLFAFFCEWTHIPLIALIITAVVAVGVMVFDMLCPSFLTRSAGGSKAATTGCTVGIIVGMFIPFGILFCPFVGALIGEMVNTEGNWSVSVKAAWHAFVGFFLGTGIKLILGIVYIVIYILSWSH